MSKDLKSLGRKKQFRPNLGKRLSLHPLSLEAALGAALQTGRASQRKHKKPVDKGRQYSR
jgi:hypothetical protein